ncbi:MAG: hypothetical protein A2086_09370 [Spirochaetes bacterium GWD1_27_9]|nr:MAG: hypothetical protein A2Z98_18305 [Spirochaetes bacterium GWB1_27_13]OHD24100.1 MAG: hypothetical protein A2Y34_09345 [Spirochaetes bacterium GWC1_27_15]OHD37370.1 MAG: hypothetical protein A2086_09370 [Spirochaetes bacterium GWD1_27_9]
MTYIITVRTNESILMASDSRLNYFEDKIINGKKYQEITALADCIQKTFFLNKLRIGIQFLGIGYFPENGIKYPLNYFIRKADNIQYVKNFKINANNIYNFFNNLSINGDTGQYVKGICTSFIKNKAYIATFNTFNNEFNCKELLVGQFIDSENNFEPFPRTEKEAIIEIKRRIKQKEIEKWWTIGGPIDILRITEKKTEFISKNSNVFNGTQDDLIYYFNNNIEKLNGKILNPSKLVEYS